jgi:hypothetical protein
MPSKTLTVDLLAHMQRIKTELPDEFREFCSLAAPFYGDVHSPEGAALRWFARRPVYISEAALGRSAGNPQARPSSRDKLFCRLYELELKFRAHIATEGPADPIVDAAFSWLMRRAEEDEKKHGQPWPMGRRDSALQQECKRATGAIRDQFWTAYDRLPAIYKARH